ncbi:uncharacterized protein LOC129944835 [Eupeodes corollae]|uniref:uncharacterized protein LOC129944835 n=1 Tax=Eupeodes corollae TaxID=290404 RepID=UPI00248F7AC4|nr:uncharacterized protein LOC129944835 [Eupeodes corollae]
MNENNVSYVWDGQFTSEDFEAEMGVRQGCVLSTLLFILFINDIVEEVGGGIEFGSLRIPCLIFADDIVFLAESVDGMQLMINRLEHYCDLWNLTVNLGKSKMMIFRDGGGRYSRNERWTYKGQNLEIVREYNYLGVLICANLNVKKHFETKLAEAKRAISSIWGRCIESRFVDHSAKIQIFRATASSIMLYGAQVWGCWQFDIVEKFQRYFLKRIFRLTACTPNYMVHLETTMPPLFLNTLKLHIDFIMKLLEMDETRLPKLILKSVIILRGNLVKKWEEIGVECGERLQIQPGIGPTILRNMFQNLLGGVARSAYSGYTLEAQSS